MASIVGVLNKVETMALANRHIAAADGGAASRHTGAQAPLGAAKPKLASAGDPTVAAVAAHGASSFVAHQPAPVAVLAANATLGAETGRISDLLQEPSTSGAVHLGFTATLGGGAMLAPTLTGAAGDIVPSPQADLQIVHLGGGATATFHSVESFAKMLLGGTTHHG